MTLSTLAIGQSARIHSLNSDDAMKRRLQDIGMIEGTRVQCLLKSPAGDPVAYLIRGAVIAIRQEDSANIIIC